jgi:hypothetical protein
LPSAFPLNVAINSSLNFAPPPDPSRLEKIRQEQEARERIAVAARLAKARWLWSQRLPIGGTPAERYLRGARGYGGPVPGALGCLPGRDSFPPTMIAALGVPTEPEPGFLAINDAAITGIHLTRIAPDGRGKAGTERDKIMIGRSLGSPNPINPAGLDDLRCQVTR